MPTELPIIPITVGSDIVKDTNSVLRKLFPSIPAASITLKEEKSGLTNSLVKATIPASGKGGKRVLLIRTFGRGSESFIDRQREVETITRLSELGFCPGIIGSFQNGMVYGYIPGQVFSTKDMKDEQRSFLVAKELSTWHRIAIPKSSKPSLFQTMYHWLELLPSSITLNGWTKNMLAKEAEALEILITENSRFNSPVVFCHNDLQCGNIIYQQPDRVKFIDYEYGAPNYRGFDLGNHFNEFGGLEGDWKKYPNHSFRMQWLKNYLTCFDDGEEPSMKKLASLEKEVLAFSCASHFFWAIWSLLQDQHSSIDFDYIGYGAGRLHEYLERKPSWLESSLDSD